MPDAPKVTVTPEDLVTPEDQLGVADTERDAFNAWLEEHDIEPRTCFKIEMVYTPNEDEDDWMVVHCYALNKDGKKYTVPHVVNPDEAVPAVEQPRTVTLKSPMPEMT